jgi:hypothetical protein
MEFVTGVSGELTASNVRLAREHFTDRSHSKYNRPSTEAGKDTAGGYVSGLQPANQTHNPQLHTIPTT